MPRLSADSSRRCRPKTLLEASLQVRAVGNPDCPRSSQRTAPVRRQITPDQFEHGTRPQHRVVRILLRKADLLVAPAAWRLGPGWPRSLELRTRRLTEVVGSGRVDAPWHREYVDIVRSWGERTASSRTTRRGTGKRSMSRGAISARPLRPLVAVDRAERCGREFDCGQSVKRRSAGSAPPLVDKGRKGRYT